MRPDQADKWLSESRFRNFLDAAGNDHERAVALYEWNAEVSAAFLGTLHHVEVLLRNAIDGQFPPTEPGLSVSICRPKVWLSDPAIVEDRGREKVNDAIARLVGEGRNPTRPRLVASLTFGFWVSLFSGRYESLWRSTLVGAFPNGNGRRNQARKHLTRILQFRNRIAHHEAIFGRDLDKDHHVLLETSDLIDSEARAYIERISGIGAVLAKRP